MGTLSLRRKKREMFSVISVVFNFNHKFSYKIFQENKNKNTLHKTIQLLLKSRTKRFDYNNWDFSIRIKKKKKFLI